MKIVEDIKGAVSKKRYNITLHARKETSPQKDDICER